MMKLFLCVVVSGLLSTTLGATPEEAITNIAEASKRFVSFSANSFYKKNALEAIDKGLQKKAELVDLLATRCTDEEVKSINDSATCGKNAIDRTAWIQCEEQVKKVSMQLQCSQAMGKVIDVIGISVEVIANQDAVKKYKEDIAGKTVFHLNYNFAKVCDKEILALVEALTGNTILKELYLIGNKIGDEGASLLADLLKQNGTLELLDLSSNNIGDEGAAALSEVLMSNTSLKTLLLADNKLQLLAGKELAKALESNSTLETLSVARNEKLFGAGVSSIITALKNNTSLKSLSLSGIHLAVLDKMDIFSLLRTNKTLNKLFLDSTRLDNDAREKIEKALLERQ